MSALTSTSRNTLQLLRIPFSLLLMPVFLLTLSQAGSIQIQTALVSFFIIHLLVYPASNGYNSYIDRDETSIGGIEKPPLPTQQLYYVTLILDGLAFVLSLFLVNTHFAFALLLYILASRAYSSKQIRLKKYPLLGFFTVIVFQGGFTYYMCTLGITNAPFEFSTTNLYIVLAATFQIAGAYPLTQIYQHQQDLKDGVTTLSYKLGYTGTFVFTAIMFALCTFCYFLYFFSTHQLNHFYLLQLFFLPVVIYFIWWFLNVLKNTKEANFKNTMRMNILASVCMNTCFIILLFLNKIH